MGRLSLSTIPVSVLHHRQTTLTRLEMLPNEVLLNIFSRTELFTRISLSRSSTPLLSKVSGLGLLDFDLNNLSTFDKTTILESLPFEIAPPTIPNGGDEAGTLVEAKLTCNCCDWAIAYKYRNHLAIFQHLRDEAEVSGLLLTRFMQPVLTHAIILKVIEYERKLDYAGLLTLKLPHQSTTSEVADGILDEQDEVDSDEDASEGEGAQTTGQMDVYSEFDDFIVPTPDGPRQFPGTSEIEFENDHENELENELSDLLDRRWDLIKDRTESESENGGENRGKGQEEVEWNDEHHLEMWQKEQEAWRKEVEEAGE